MPTEPASRERRPTSQTREFLDVLESLQPISPPGKDLGTVKELEKSLIQAMRARLGHVSSTIVGERLVLLEADIRAGRDSLVRLFLSSNATGEPEGMTIHLDDPNVGKIALELAADWAEFLHVTHLTPTYLQGTRSLQNLLHSSRPETTTDEVGSFLSRKCGEYLHHDLMILDREQQKAFLIDFGQVLTELKCRIAALGEAGEGVATEEELVQESARVLMSQWLRVARAS
ncbi:MAG: hypothetical protein V1908_01410 [Candidatus Peregrinibacteria bacterium]